MHLVYGSEPTPVLPGQETEQGKADWSFIVEFKGLYIPYPHTTYAETSSPQVEKKIWDGSVPKVFRSGGHQCKTVQIPGF